MANTGIAGQGASSGLTIPGGLVRVNSAGNGRGAPYDPYSLTFADSVSRLAGNHFMKFGADVRMIRMTTDQLGGTTYSFANLNAFLANTPTTIQYFGDLSEPSPFSNGASGPKHTKQEYYVGYAQDEWRVRSELHAELRPPLRLLHAAQRGRQPDRQVQHRHRTDRPADHAACSLRRRTASNPVLRRRSPPRLKNRPPRGLRHLRRTGTDRRPDSADRGRAHQHHAVERSAPRLPARSGAGAPELHQQPEQPLVPAAGLRERLHAAGARLSIHDVDPAGAAGTHGGDGRLHRQPGAATCSCAASPTAPSACSRTAPRPPPRSASSTS